MTMITPSYLGETIEYSSLHACRSTLEDPTSLAYARRLSLISPEALYATKRAVNRVADAAGFRTALYAGLDVVGPLYATKTEHGTRFREIATTVGVPAAVKWRSAQFKG